MGAPVVASRLAAFVEVAGSYATWVDDPLSIEEWAKRIRESAEISPHSDAPIRSKSDQRKWSDVAEGVLQVATDVVNSARKTGDA